MVHFRSPLLDKLIARLVTILRNRSSLLAQFIPLVCVDGEEFKRIYLTDADQALDDTRLPLAFRHADYAKALMLTGASLSTISNEFKQVLAYTPAHSLRPRKRALAFEWFARGVSEPLLSLQEQALSRTQDDALVAEYALNLIELGHQERALDYLDSYPGRNNINYSLYLPLAHTVATNRPWASKYSEQSRLFAWLEANQQRFELAIRSNSICIVGNSPIETGRRRGTAIDSHSLIIRFNNFSVDESHQKDYGTKTDAWVRAGSLDVKDRWVSGLSFVIWEEDIWHTKLLPETCSQMLACMQAGIAATYIPAQIHQELRQLADLATPSAGLVTCYWVYKLLGRLDRESVFGFSMIDQGGSEADRHYFKSSPQSNRVLHHDWAKEREMLNFMLTSADRPRA